MTTLIHGNGRDLTRFADTSIDAVITDHPWDDTANKGGNRSFADYSCFSYEPEDFSEKARVLKDGAFLVEVLPAETATNFDYLYKLKTMARDAGLIYYAKVPWVKGTFVSNTGRKAKNTQDIMFFTKGKARNLRLDAKRTKKLGYPVYMSGTRGMLPTDFNVQPVPKKNRVHQSEMPVELIERIIGHITEPGEVILDQFAGSGVVGEAAQNTGREAILIEADEEHISTIEQRLL